MHPTTTRDSVWTMLHHDHLDDQMNPNQLEASFAFEGLRCVVLRISDRHYCGYVQLPTFIREMHDGDWPSRYQIEHLWKCRPHGGISYGPDRAGWVGFDTNHGEDINLDAEGDPLPNQHGYELPDWLTPKEWPLDEVKRETQAFASLIADSAWRLREGIQPPYREP